MSLSPVGLRAAYVSFPRVSGDEPALVSIISGAIKFSPRERG